MPACMTEIPLYRGEPTLYELPCEPKAFRKGSTYRQKNPGHIIDPISANVNKWTNDVMMAEGRPLNTSSQLEDMILAQHYGVATRLLDWSTNPLVALWFSATYRKDETGFVYVFHADGILLEMTGESFLTNEDDSDRNNALNINPYNFDGDRGIAGTYTEFVETHFFKPRYLPDARVLAQSGVISIHPAPNSFDMNALASKYEIEAHAKYSIKRELDTLGINFRTMGLATRESIAKAMSGPEIV